MRRTAKRGRPVILILAIIITITITTIITTIINSFIRSEILYIILAVKVWVCFKYIIEIIQTQVN